jgi:MazG family protein
VVDAIEQGTAAELAEELGDLLLQVFLQAEIAEEAGSFGLSDVVRGLSDKLIRRHPHVFGSSVATTADEVERNWDRLKQAEKPPRESAVDGIPRSLPALERARQLQRRMSGAGFDWPNREGAAAKLGEELAEMRAASGDHAALSDEVGDALFALCKVATDAGVDAEAALRKTVDRVEGRFRAVERQAAERAAALAELGVDELLDLWDAAKRQTD